MVNKIVYSLQQGEHCKKNKFFHKSLKLQVEELPGKSFNEKPVDESMINCYKKSCNNYVNIYNIKNDNNK